MNNPGSSGDSPTLRNVEAARVPGVSLEGLGIWHSTALIRSGPYAGEQVQALGKGLSIEERRSSAMGECLERRAVFERSADVVASYAKLGAAALDPRSLGLDLAGEEAPTCIAFDPQIAISWSCFRSLTSGHEKFVPRPMRGEDGAFFVHTTSGAASGSSPEAALSGGLLELVERDALTLAWRTGYGGRLVPVDHAPGAAIGWLAKHGLRTSLRDITSDLRIPVVLAIAQRANAGSITGCSCGPTLAQAARGAVLEIVQAYEAHLYFLATGDERMRLDDNLQEWFSAIHGDVLHYLPAALDAEEREEERPLSSLSGIVNRLAHGGFQSFGLVEEVALGWYVAETVAPGLVPFPKEEGSRGMRLGAARLQAAADASRRELNRRPIPL